MLDKTFDVVLASVYGRSSWLACELSHLGLSVAVVDFSSQMGRWTPQDIEGPFGYFRRKKFSSSQLERIQSEAAPHEVSGGFTVWLDDGPLPFRGGTIRHRIQKLKVLPQAVDLVEQCEYGSGHREFEDLSRVQKKEFRESWICYLSSRWASVLERDNSHEFVFDELVPFFNSYFVRQAELGSKKRLCEFLHRNDVSYFTADEFGELRTKKNNVSGIEFSHFENGIRTEHFFKCDHLVWSLTSHETRWLSQSLLQMLFPGGVSKVEECWTRFRVSIEDDPCLSVLPDSFFVLDELFLNWSGVNFFGVLATSKKNHYDVWLKTPVTQRFDRLASLAVFESCAKKLQEKLRGLEVEIVSLPQDLIHGESSMRASGYYLYKDLESLRRKPSKNLHFDGPETWKSYEWGHRLQRQSDILKSFRENYKNKMSRDSATESRVMEI